MDLDVILIAIENVQTLRIRYFGGSNPGSERDLIPVSVNDGKVRAICMPSKETKTFALEKMELVVDGVGSTLAAKFPPVAGPCDSISEFVALNKQQWRQLGWTVNHDDKALTLHRSFKNGKVIQTPDVALTFEATEFDLVFDGEKVTEANHRPRSRPWIVRAKNSNTKTFGDFGKAQAAIKEFAALLAPLK